MTLRKPVLAATAALILTLVFTAAAQAWPRPPQTVPPAGVDVCVPAMPAGSFTVEHVTTQQRLNELRATRSTHVAENGTCEGPVVPPPTPTPVPTPTPTPVPPVPTPPVPTPTPTPPPNCGPGTACCPICVSGRKQRIVLSRYARISRRSARTTVYEAVRSARMMFTRARPSIVAANQQLAASTGNQAVLGDPNGERVTVPMTFQQVPSMGGRRLVAIADWSQLRAVKGQVFHVTIRGRTVTGKAFREGRSYRLCMQADGDLNEPSDQRRD